MLATLMQIDDLMQKPPAELTPDDRKMLHALCDTFAKTNAKMPLEQEINLLKTIHELAKQVDPCGAKTDEEFERFLEERCENEERH